MRSRRKRRRPRPTEQKAFAEQLDEYLADPANVEQLQKKLAEPAKAEPAADKETDSAKADKSLAELIAPNAEEPTMPANPTWGEFDPGRGFLVGQIEDGRVVPQRLRPVAVPQPDARRADLHGPPRQRANHRWPRRLRRPSHHVVGEGLVVQSEADLQPDLLDRLRDRPGRHLRDRRLSILQAIQPVRRHQRHMAARAPSRVPIPIGSATTG